MDDRTFNFFFKLVFGMIIVAWIVVGCFWLFVGSKAVEVLNSDCTPAVVVEESNGTKTYSVECKE